MIYFPEDTCVPCLKRLAVQAAKLATELSPLQDEAIWAANQIILENFPKINNPAKIASLYHVQIRKISKNNDPFLNWKKREIDYAREMFVKVHEKFPVDDLISLLKLSVLGNSLDFFNTQEETDKAMETGVEFKINEFGKFMELFNKAEKILLLADNAGEVFFDLPLCQYIKSCGKDITYVVKAHPVQNDVTLDDINYSKISNEFPGVLTNEYEGVGFVPELAGAGFKKIYEQADLIIAKGMGHLETLRGKRNDRLFYLLKAKCQPIANQLKIPKDSYVLGVYL